MEIDNVEAHIEICLYRLLLLKKNFPSDALEKCCSDGGREGMSRQPFAAFAMCETL